MKKIEKFEITYNWTKGKTCNRIKTLENATIKACFKVIANFMKKGYKIYKIKINGIEIDEYIKEYCQE